MANRDSVGYLGSAVLSIQRKGLLDLLDGSQDESVLGLPVHVRATQEEHFLWVGAVVLAQLVDHVREGHVVEQLFHIEVGPQELVQHRQGDLLCAEQVRLHHGPQLAGLRNEGGPLLDRQRHGRRLQSGEDQ